MLHTDVTFVRMLNGRLQKLKQVDDYTWNCRCPECGDSSKSARKARGYFFKLGDSILYHCHNCSDKSKPLPKFLKDNFPDVFDEYRKEQLREKFGDNWEQVKERKARERARLEEERKRQPHTLPTDPDMGIPLHELSADHPANEYVRGRRLPEFEAYYTEDIKGLAKRISSRYNDRRFPQGPRLVIPHRDASNELLGVTCRDISGASGALKYVHLRVNQDNFFIYGLNTVDFSRPVIVVEGQFDSLFLDNAIAVGGSAMKKVQRMIQAWNLTPKTFIFAWDNDSRNRDIYKFMHRSIMDGFHTTIWDHKRFKAGSDINDMVQSGLRPKKIQEWIHNHSSNNSEADKMRLLLRLNQWTRCNGKTI